MEKTTTIIIYCLPLWGFCRAVLYSKWTCFLISSILQYCSFFSSRNSVTVAHYEIWHLPWLLTYGAVHQSQTSLSPNSLVFPGFHDLRMKIESDPIGPNCFEMERFHGQFCCMCSPQKSMHSAQTNGFRKFVLKEGLRLATVIHRMFLILLPCWKMSAFSFLFCV